jgi:glycosidase
MTSTPRFEFHVSRHARRAALDDALFTLSGNVVFADLDASRRFAHRMNLAREADRHPERAVPAAALHAMGLIDELLHLIVARYRAERDPGAMEDALRWFEERLGRASVDQVLLAFAEEFPVVDVHREHLTAPQWLAASTGGTSHRAVALEEILMLALANRNPAFTAFGELFDETPLAARSDYRRLVDGLHAYFETRPRYGPENQNLVDLLEAPARASPTDLVGQLAFIRDRWNGLLGGQLRRLLVAIDALREEAIAVWMRFQPPRGADGEPPGLGDSSTRAVPRFGLRALDEVERFSRDLDWMPRTVMIAKSVFVWLDQLSRAQGRPIHRLDQIPDEELDRLADRGFNALWMIGVWERSRASQRIKQIAGNPEAAASAYSLQDYVVAAELGGEAACASLRERAAARGIRLASDMVPNHMGIDSRWVIEHPGWFVSLPYAPFPSYRFDGPDLSSDGRVEIKIEDRYYDRSDAAVVFRRVDRWTGDTRYVYHGNDGTSMPWNDTAQLDYLKPEVREAVIQTILHVARQFPIIRFDAAMTLTRRHFQRLWFPEPGSGGAIPSRAEHGLSAAEFDAAMPHEFWREVVDRVAAEVPDTLLLAEAFWLLEGYFVRTLGMHRVYNSAFMNMLRDEENANYRSVIKNTIEFDPEVLKRYVNFMNNPDERTAVDQFGKGDKYFGVCTLMATLPGLPMFGHGQFEGLAERYGMEYRRAYRDEAPDPALVARHEREISPLLHRRALFAEVSEFLLYDFFTDDGWVNEDVFAYSNRSGDARALVVYHNRYANTRGWIRVSSGYAEKAPDGGRRLRQRTLGEAFGLSSAFPDLVAFRDARSGLEHLHRAADLADKGLRLELDAYRCHVFLDWKEWADDGRRPWRALCDELGGRGVASLERALRALELRPVHQALGALLELGRDPGSPASTLFRTWPEQAVDRLEGLSHAVSR